MRLTWNDSKLFPRKALTAEERRWCEQGIEALRNLYDTCKPEHYMPDCISCQTGRLIRDMEGILADERL